MARQLDYEWEKEWVNGKTWVAVAGEDFPEGEEELFLVWLQQMANVEDKWAITRITRMRYSSGRRHPRLRQGQQVASGGRCRGRAATAEPQVTAGTRVTVVNCRPPCAIALTEVPAMDPSSGDGLHRPSGYELGQRSGRNECVKPADHPGC